MSSGKVARSRSASEGFGGRRRKTRTAVGEQLIWAGASWAALGVALAAAPCAAVAAEPTAAGASAAASTSPVVSNATELSELVVTGKRNDIYNVLPTRKTRSLFGVDVSVAELPRSVTLIESPLISLFGIRTVDDFVNITPGTFTSNYFGIPGSLAVRSDKADNFFRGFRRIENNGNFPTTVGAADYVEVIKGPPPVIDGGGKVGGILNFVPKGPTDQNGNLITKPTGSASFTYGSYDKRVADLEYGTPFSLAGAPSGVYAALQGEDSRSFYKNVYTKNLLLQVSAKTQVNNSLSAEYGGMAQWSDLVQEMGWNRVTQQLIDSNGKSYLAGRPALNLSSNGKVITAADVAAAGLTESAGLNQYAWANPFQLYYLSSAQQAAYALDPSTVHYTSLSHHDVLADSLDFVKSNVYTGYFDLIYDLGDGWTVKNQSFYDQMIHQKYSSYGFTADYRNYAFENKTTLSGKYSPVSFLTLEPVVGISYRISGGREREARDHYQAENRRDLSIGATANDRFGCGCDGSQPYNWDQKGHYTDAGAFALLNAALGPRVTGIFGVRVDRYHDTDTGTDNYGYYHSLSDSKSAFTYNGSLSFKVTKTVNLYASYASSEYLELGQGGLVGEPNLESKNWIQPSKLFEYGLKGFLDDGRLYFSLSRYDQRRSSYDVLYHQFNYYHSTGEEFEAHFAATKRISLVASGTWQDTKLLNAPYFVSIPPQLLGLDPVQTYGGTFSGVVYGINGPVDVPAPERVFSLNATYTAPQGWGVSLGGTHVSSTWAGYADLVRLPAYSVMRGAIFYNFGKWSVQLNGNNLLNAQYFTPQVLFGDVFVNPSIGRTVEMRLMRKW